MIKFYLVNIVLTCIILTACSVEQVKESTYHALKDKDCMETHGYPNCNEDAPGYEEYKKQKEESL